MKKLVLIILVIIILLTIISCTQKNILWEKKFNFSGNYIKDADEYIIYGIDESYENEKYPHVIRINSEGDIIVDKVYDTFKVTTINARKTNNGVILVGLLGILGVNTTPYLININSDGSIVYEEVFDFEHADIVDVKFIDNDLFIIGNAYDKGYSEGTGGSSLYYIITDLDNKKSKVSKYRINNITSGGFIEKTTNNNYIIMGQTKTDSMDLYKLVIDNNGKIIDEEIIGTEYDEYIQTFKRIEEKGYIASAMLYNQDNKNYTSYFLLLDEKGEKVWERKYPINIDRSIRYINEDDEGFLISTPCYNGENLLVTKINWEGNLIWQKDFNISFKDIIYSQLLVDDILIIGKKQQSTI